MVRESLGVLVAVLARELCNNLRRNQWHTANRHLPQQRATHGSLEPEDIVIKNNAILLNSSPRRDNIVLRVVRVDRCSTRVSEDCVGRIVGCRARLWIPSSTPEVKFGDDIKAAAR